MKITAFARCVALVEGKKRQLPIAQIMEVLKIVDGFIGGRLYSEIRRTARCEVGKLLSCKKY